MGWDYLSGCEFLFLCSLKVRSIASKRWHASLCVLASDFYLSKKPFLVGDFFVVKLLMIVIGYSARRNLNYSHSSACLTFPLAGFGRPTGNADSAPCTCGSSSYVCFTVENLAMAVCWISLTR